MKSIPRLLVDAEKGHADRHWYTHAHTTITSIATRHDVPVTTVAGVAAVLSPRISVSRNVRLTDVWFEYAHTYKDNEARVRWFVHDTGITRSTGAALLHYLKTGHIRGPKTSQFALALAGNLNACPLDVWMARSLEVPQRTLSRRGTRALAVSRITQVANTLGWRVAETQAALWATAYRSWYASPVLPQFTPGA